MNRICPMVTPLLVVAGALGQQTNLPANLEPLFQKGVEAQMAGRIDEAEKAFLEVLAGGGKVAFVYNNLGIVYQQRGQHESAVAQFQRAVKLSPSYVAPRILLGASLLALGRTAESRAELERAVKLAPEEPQARLALAKTLERAGEPFAAVDQLRKLCGLRPNDAEFAYRLAKAYRNAAGWAFERIKALEPKSARLYQVLGESYGIQGHNERAVKAFQQAIQADPKLAGSHLALAYLYRQNGRREEALKEIDLELAVAPGTVAAEDLRKRLARSE